MKILGIETSCDETAASVIEAKAGKIKVLSSVVSSQIDIHKKYGGVIPEVAAREHVLNILPAINEALQQAGIKREQASKQLAAIAVTAGPGLITSLIVGAESAKTLAFAWKLPLVSVNHIEGHIAANFINDNKKNIFPSIILTVSGGHTTLILMTGFGKFKVIGQTRDDAAGEAFDKAAALLGLGYPGGPAISKRAEQIAQSKIENRKSRITLPRPMLNAPNFDFSFSGLKTALLYAVRADKDWEKNIDVYCAEFQQAVVDVLIGKTIKAAKKFQAKSIMLTGGVAANIQLRRQMAEKIISNLPEVEFMIPNLAYTTDNAAMIAVAGYFKARDKKFTDWRKLKVDPTRQI